MSVNKSKMDAYFRDRGHFVMVPNELWELKGVDQYSKVIWCYVYSQREDWASSRNNLARNLNMHHTTVSKHVEQLEAMGMLEVDRTKESWSFTPLPPTNWDTECTGLKVSQATECTTTELKNSSLPSYSVSHTKDSILKTSSSKFDNSDILKMIQKIIDSKVQLNSFETSLIADLSVKLKSYKASEKQKALVEGLYARIPVSEVVVKTKESGSVSYVLGIMFGRQTFGEIKTKLLELDWNEDFSNYIDKGVAENLHNYRLTETEVAELKNIVNPGI
jgi:biotin operon repressor